MHNLTISFLVFCDTTIIQCTIRINNRVHEKDREKWRCKTNQNKTKKKPPPTLSQAVKRSKTYTESRLCCMKCIHINFYLFFLFRSFSTVFNLARGVCVCVYACIWPIWVCECVHVVQIEFINDAMHFIWQPHTTATKKKTWKTLSSLESYCVAKQWRITYETIRNQIYPKTSARKLWYGTLLSWTNNH